MDIIEAIVKIESDAGELVKGVEEARERLPERAETERKRVIAAIEAETKAEIARLIDEANAAKSAEITRIRMDFEAKKQRMLKEFVDRHIEWENDMLKQIIGR